MANAANCFYNVVQLCLLSAHEREREKRRKEEGREKIKKGESCLPLIIVLAGRMARDYVREKSS